MPPPARPKRLTYAEASERYASNDLSRCLWGFPKAEEVCSESTTDGSGDLCVKCISKKSTNPFNKYLVKVGLRKDGRGRRGKLSSLSSSPSLPATPPNKTCDTFLYTDSGEGGDFYVSLKDRGVVIGTVKSDDRCACVGGKTACTVDALYSVKSFLSVYEETEDYEFSNKKALEPYGITRYQPVKDGLLYSLF